MNTRIPFHSRAHARRRWWWWWWWWWCTWVFPPLHPRASVATSWIESTTRRPHLSANSIHLSVATRRSGATLPEPFTGFSRKFCTPLLDYVTRRNLRLWDWNSQVANILRRTRSPMKLWTVVELMMDRSRCKERCKKFKNSYHSLIEKDKSFLVHQIFLYVSLYILRENIRSTDIFSTSTLRLEARVENCKTA